MKEGEVKRQEYFNLGKKAATEVVKEYSEGESGSEFFVKLKDLNRQAQLHRLMFLWRKAYTRARGGSRLIQVFYHLHKRILLFGTTKNLLGERGTINRHEILKRKTCLIMPDSKFKVYWNIIIILLLLYTALFVPFKIAFIETDG